MIGPMALRPRSIHPARTGSHGGLGLPRCSRPQMRRGQRIRSASIRGWSLAGFAGAALVGVMLSARVAQGAGILGERWGLLGVLAAWALVWLVGVSCAFRLPRRWALAAVFVVAVALRLAALTGPPSISDDLFRYAWDGHVQASGVDPYRFAPTSPHLAGLRDPWLWPDDRACADLHRPPGCTRINRPSERTIYPPAAQAWFALVFRVGGLGLRDHLWQVAGFVGDLALLPILAGALRSWGRDPRWCALYALSPIAVVEVVNNAHVDGLAALIAAASLWAAARRRAGPGSRWRPAPAVVGAALGLATLVKLYPAMLVAGLVAGRPGTRAGRRWPTGAGAALVVTVAVGYGPHVLAVGTRVLGYLPGYLSEERYGQGGRFLLLAVVGHWPALTLVLATLAVIGLLMLVVRYAPAPPEAMALLLGGALLVATPVQPWYAVTLLALATVAAQPVWAVVAAAGYPYYFTVVLDDPRAVLIGRLSYGVALVAVVVVGARQRRGWLITTREERLCESSSREAVASSAATSSTNSSAPALM